MSLKNFAFQYKQNGSIVLYHNGHTDTIAKTAINYNMVLDAIRAGDYETALKHASVATAAADLSDGRVSIYGDDIYLDKTPVNNALTARIVGMFRDGFNVTPLVRFLENVMANPSKTSQDELYLFLEHNNLPITPDGHFLAYKVVNHRYYDCHSDTIDNSVGQSPRMDRGAVDAVRDRTCSHGLHFCSFEYVQHFHGNHLMVVKINPADVVSIPSDYNNAKGRCAGYTVVDEVDGFNDTLPGGFTRQYSADDDAADELPEVDEVDTTVADAAADLADDVTEPNYSAKLTEHSVREIRRLLNDPDWTLVGIGKLFGVSARQVARIRDGEAWADVI